MFYKFQIMHVNVLLLDYKILYNGFSRTLLVQVARIL